MSWKSGPAKINTWMRSQRHWSLATRLTIWYAGSAFAVVLITTGFLYGALVVNLNRQDDQFLIDEILILRDVLFKHSEQPSEFFYAVKHELEWETAARQYARVFVRLLDDKGQTVAETPSMHEALPAAWFPEAGSLTASVHGSERKSAEGVPFRLLAANLGSVADGPLVIQIAMNQSRTQELLAQYRLMLMLVMTAALVVCCVVAHSIARRGTRPVLEITHAARRIRSTTLHQRIEAGEFPSEFSALAETFNDMLNRLQESFERLSRFSADIAHELRTPVNNLRGEAEVTLSKQRSLDEYQDALASSLEESVRLSRIIDGLLLMARAETPAVELPREPVELAGELATLVEFYDAAAADIGVQLDLHTQPNLWIQASRPLVQRAIGNLVENALSHTPSGGQIHVAAAAENGHVRLDISDTGCGIPPEDVGRVFDRFFRVEFDRSSSTGGSGLGLAIVRSIVQLHGGTVGLQSTVGVGTTVTLALPSEVGGSIREQ